MKKPLPPEMEEVLENLGQDDQPPEQPKNGDDAEIERLARLSLFEYERARKEAAERLGTRASILDKLIASARAELGLDRANDRMQGRAVEYEEPESWPEPVDGAKLLDDLAASARRFTVLPPDGAEISALWKVHTYLSDATDYTPRLQASSPTKGCGKTTYLDYLSEVVYRPDLVSNISASALFRTVEEWRPCLLLDEADSFLFENEAMRNVLNSGHHVKGSVKISVKVGDNYEPRIFSTFAPVAFGLIGELKGQLATVNDRSIRIVLQRRKPDEKIESLSGPRRRDEFKPLRRRIMRWAQDHRAAIAEAEPKIPDALFNRVADNWRPLLAIADAAGGKWPKLAREIALRAAPSEEQTAVEMLIADIWEVFNAIGPDRIGSQKLVDKLVEMTDRPWPEFGKSGKPITQAKLARLLNRPGLGISPKQIWVTDDKGDEKQVRGYECSQFGEAFARFVPEKGLPKCQSVTNPDEMGTSDISKPSQAESDVTLRKSQKPNNDGTCDGLRLRKGGNGKTDAKTSIGPRIRVIGNCGPDAVCQHCRQPGEVKRVKNDAEVGGKSETLHEACAAAWFTKLANARIDSDEVVEDEPGLSVHQIGWLASWYYESAYSRRDEPEIEAKLNRELRHRLTAEFGVFPEYLNAEFKRVKDQVFKM